MGQTLFDEPSLSGLSHDYSWWGRGGVGCGGGLGWENQEALPAAASDGTITECRKSKFKTH